MLNCFEKRLSTRTHFYVIDKNRTGVDDSYVFAVLKQTVYILHEFTETFFFVTLCTQGCKMRFQKKRYYVTSALFYLTPVSDDGFILKKLNI